MVVTRAGRIKGKFSYMAPEQARSIDVDARADIWSVGVVLWELLTKHRLFKAETEIKTLERLLGDDMKEVLRPVAGVPEELLVIARRALEREREQRYATASEMREALEGYLSSQQPVTNADVGRFVSTVFDDVIEQHQKALGNILARAGAVDSAVTLDIDIEDSRDTSAPLLHVGHKQSRHSWPTESGARRRDKPRGLQQRSILVAAAIVGVAVIAAAWLARGPDESTSRRPSADADTEMDLEPSPAHPPTPPSAPAVAPLPPAAAASAPLVQAATSPEAIAQEQEQEQESSARVGRRQRPRGRQQRAATQRAAPAHEPSSDTQQTVEHEAPAPPAAQEEFGFLTIDTSPWSEVFLNGRSLGPTPLIRARLPAGSHVLSLRNSERGISMQYSVSIRPGQLTTRRLGL